LLRKRIQIRFETKRSTLMRLAGRRKLDEHLDRVFEGHREETSAAHEPVRYLHAT
jgi:hypothetical protein